MTLNPAIQEKYLEEKGPKSVQNTSIVFSSFLYRDLGAMLLRFWVQFSNHIRTQGIHFNSKVMIHFQISKTQIYVVQ